MKGSCLCKRVCYQVDEPIKLFQYCHCSRCRKITGSAHASNFYVPPEQFQWLTGEKYVGRYEVPEAKYYATSFCKECGSTLPWEVKGGGNMVIPAGTIDEKVSLKPLQNIFWDSRAEWYEETCEMVKHSELPPRKR